jgi:hypothetical protein
MRMITGCKRVSRRERNGYKHGFAAYRKNGRRSDNKKRHKKEEETVTAVREKLFSKRENLVDVVIS